MGCRAQREEEKVTRKQKIELRQYNDDLQEAQEAIRQEWQERVVKPFEEWTGLNTAACVSNHAEPDEEEEVTDNDDAAPEPAVTPRRKAPLK